MIRRAKYDIRCGITHNLTITMTPRSSRDPKLIFVGCLLLLMLIEWLDWVIPHDLSVLLLYIVPIWIASWFLNLGSVVFFSLAAVAYQTFLHISHPTHTYSHWWIPYWNSGMRMGILLLFGYFIVRIRFFVQEREELLEMVSEGFTEAWNIGGLFPMCPGCKQMRNDAAYQAKLQSYLDRPKGQRFIHLDCPHCAKAYEAEYTPLTPGL